MAGESVPNPDLRDHVTRVGFSLTLTRPQIEYLCILAEGIRFNVQFTHFITVGRALERKGLLDLHRRPHPMGGTASGGKTLTAAGEHVIGLLKEAGLYQEIVRQVDGGHAA